MEEPHAVSPSTPGMKRVVSTPDSAMAAFRLCHAASRGDLESVRSLLVESGLNPNAADYDGRTALHIAAEEGQLELVRMLLNHGAAHSPEDRWMVTPLRGALKAAHRDVAELLREAGAALPSNQDFSQFSESMEHMLDVFKAITCGDETMTLQHVDAFVRQKGFPHISEHVEIQSGCKRLLGSREEVSFASFQLYVNKYPDDLLARVFTNRLSAVGDWDSFVALVKQIFDESLAEPVTGKNADYIPSLAEYDPSLYGISIVTVEGQVLNIGDTHCTFPIESCCKPILYSLALQKTSHEYVHRFVGQEPSGHAFNAFMLTPDNKPHNPLINAGAIMTSAILFSESKNCLSTAFDDLVTGIRALSGRRNTIGFNQSVYLSEKETAFTNYALTYYMRARGEFPDKSNNSETIRAACDLYLQACSIEVSAETCAVLAATFANGGVCPLTNEEVLKYSSVKATLSMMLSCGMYDYSGRWCVEIGIPAKSGVSGIIYMSLPCRLGVAIYSPPLDPQGNSCRGVHFGRLFADSFRCNVFDLLFDPGMDSVADDDHH